MVSGQLRWTDTKYLRGALVMSVETVEQLKARLKRQDEEKEKAFQKTLEQIKADNAP